MTRPGVAPSPHLQRLSTIMNKCFAILLLRMDRSSSGRPRSMLEATLRRQRFVVAAGLDPNSSCAADGSEDERI